MVDTAAVEERNERPSHRQLVERARALQPLLREHAAEGEMLRRLPDTVSDALAAAGMFRLFTPIRFGGYCADLGTVLEVTETLGEADGSAAWLVAIGSTASRMVGDLCVPQVQEEIFGANPDARLAGSATRGSAQQVDGGLRVSGRWPYASGSYHADWVSLAATVDGSAAPGEAVFCVIPRTQLQLEKSWYTVGMRATGSDTWVADDVFVPDYRTIPSIAITERTSRVAGEEPMYRLPFAPVATLLLVGPVLGLGRAALDLVVDKAPAKALHDTFITQQSESVGVQIQIAEAALSLHTARLHAYDIAATLDTAATDSQELTYAVRAEFRARAGYVAQQVLNAVSSLLNVHGAGSFAESSRMQQYWRDASIAARHATLQATVGYEVYGKSLLGVSERISPAV